MAEFRYKAFISYSHKNNREAVWLMKRLETYRVPPHIDLDPHGNPKSGSRLGKMFRDREELPASGSLDSQLREAIKGSEFMIVVCSRDSAKSARVNNEIRQFIAHRDSRNILCFIVDGEPKFEAPGVKPDGGCIPPELRKLHLVSGQVPLAADARPKRDGKTLAVQKLIAGLLKVDLDVLLRRDIKRKYQRLLIAAAASFAITLVTTGLMFRANVAEDAARQAMLDSEQQQVRAEDLVSFMLDDLAAIRLMQLGRIDVMDAVVSKIVDHYAQQDDTKLSPDALARKTQAYLQLGRLYLGRDLRDPAAELFEYAYETTKSLLARYPDSRSARFEHSISLYWIGLNHVFNGRYREAEKAWRARLTVAEPLWQFDDHPRRVWSALTDMNVHLGWALMEIGRYEEAYENFKIGLENRKSNLEREPERVHWKNAIGGGYHHLQWAQQYLGMREEALSNAVTSNELYRQLTEADPLDQQAAGNYARSLRWRADTEIAYGMHEEAEDHLLNSLVEHHELLAFEPDNMTYQYQECVTTVTLAELYWKIGKSQQARSIIEANCPTAASTLSLEHFKAHHRFYGYRLALLQMSMALGEKDHKAAHVVYARLRKGLKHESDVALSSLQGKRVSLSFAILAVALNELDGSIPDARQALAQTIQMVERSPLNKYPPAVDLLSQARSITNQTAQTADQAR